MANSETLSIKPFLRWAGGKQWLTHKLIGMIPKYDCTYHEPFLGGGSLFFAARPKKAILSDINEQLVGTYRILRDHPNDLIAVLSQWRNEKDTYYDIRSTDYKDDIHKAAQFIYLNKTCWNGLYRVNRQGKYNVPFGYNNRRVFEETHLMEVSSILQNAEIICRDFQQTLKSAKTNDFVYLDPPYTVLHAQNGFRHYNEKLFSWQDQIRLSETARDLSDRGCIVVVSNADNDDVRLLYEGFSSLKVTRYSILAANPTHRRKTNEYLFVSLDHMLL